MGIGSLGSCEALVIDVDDVLYRRALIVMVDFFDTPYLWMILPRKIVLAGGIFHLW